ncbi:GSCFA domain-containing protein [Flavobacterium aquariorum]|uniref:GSCFA domain-containing protein n=1 Tax=Flavobacterium aquariorum TaxID=2217670 RepID=A0A2W7TPR8_9FLAO|nr:GSCFA domain-containing protein [Flavobacterium aquariorum]PZX92251.1 GSCFA domain-containing protein [Flavobacterium aquariorum]
MNFTTKIDIPQNPNPIDYNSKIVSLGSCFAENMGDKFQYFKFQSTINPFGIIFNPVSIEKIIDRVINEVLFTEEDIFFHNERWHCFEVHSDLSNSDASELLVNLNQILRETKKQLQEATHVIITYGTSWVYQSIEKNAVVANCHKVPQKQFDKELLSVQAIQESIENVIRLIQLINPKCNFIFTISPVRHLKDGFVENQVSKAHLISTIYHVLKESAIYNLQSIVYFPSYEIMMDELRDYRFYAEDMLHPSQMAIDYIWERFKESTISETAYSTMDVVEGIQKGLQHRPFNPHSESHKKFEVNLQSKIATLVAQYSFMKF